MKTAESETILNASSSSCLYVRSVVLLITVPNAQAKLFSTPLNTQSYALLVS
jgi:hypothetical protein